MRTFALILGVSLAACTSSNPTPMSGGPVDIGDLQITAPHAHDNLTIVFLRPKQVPPPADYMTLEEAIATGLVTVTEKEDAQVRRLQIENRGDRPVFIMAGDVLKGGRQDRTIQSSMIIPGKSGKQEIPSLCVERGRWSGGKQFGNGFLGACTNRMRYAARKGEQSKVWDEVKKQKEMVRRNAGVTLPAETDSINEEVYLPEVKAKLEDYEKALSGLLEKYPDAVGFAYAVNGKVRSCDLFPHPSILKKLYPKLLRSAAADALAHKGEAAGNATPTAEDWTSLLQEPQKKESESLMLGNEQIAAEDDERACFTNTYNKQVIHRQYLKK